MAELYTQEEQHQLDAAHAAIMKSSAVDLCSIWHTVEPHWSAIITLVKKIPIFGGKLAALLTAFGTALDACCPKQSKASNSAFIGQTLRGRAVTTIVGGAVRYDIRAAKRKTKR